MRGEAGMITEPAPTIAGARARRLVVAVLAGMPSVTVPAVQGHRRSRKSATDSATTVGRHKTEAVATVRTSFGGNVARNVSQSYVFNFTFKIVLISVG